MSEQPTLFSLHEQLSPRLQWMRENEVRTHYADHCKDSMWCAWTKDNEQEAGLPYDPDRCGYGKTEAAAIDDLADVLGVVNWGQPWK